MAVFNSHFQQKPTSSHTCLEDCGRPDEKQAVRKLQAGKTFLQAKIYIISFLMKPENTLRRLLVECRYRTTCLAVALSVAFRAKRFQNIIFIGKKRKSNVLASQFSFG